MEEDDFTIRNPADRTRVKRLKKGKSIFASDIAVV